MKSPIRWYIYWKATKVYDLNLPILKEIADFIRDKTRVYEDHKD